MAKKILITGAGGFIGSHLVEGALKRGYEVYAAVRHSTNIEYLQDKRIQLTYLTFNDENKLDKELSQLAEKGVHWDYIIYNLGATKCKQASDFDRINYGFLHCFVGMLMRYKMVPEIFTMTSSLSAIGEGDEIGYTPLTPDVEPHPNTRYGESKLKAENYLRSLPDFPYLIMRPTGVYGPREKDYFLMIKSINMGIDFGVGYKKQLLSFIYVTDLVDAVFAAIEKGCKRKEYFIAEGATYTQKEFRDIVSAELNRHFVLPLVLPLWVVRVVSVVAEKCAAMFGNISTLNSDKYKIMRQRNWACDVSAAKRDFGFAPNHTLAQGIKECVAWYREHKWL